MGGRQNRRASVGKRDREGEVFHSRHILRRGVGEISFSGRYGLGEAAQKLLLFSVGEAGAGCLIQPYVEMIRRGPTKN